MDIINFSYIVSLVTTTVTSRYNCTTYYYCTAYWI